LNILSYNISENTPLYGNGKGISITSDKEISNGDSCNTMNITFPNHTGTHIDLPCHFDPNGNSLSDYPPNFWEFNQVELVDLSNKIKECELVSSDKFLKIINPEIDLLLIKTGFWKYRGTDKYTLTAPGISSELAGYLREKFLKLRCIGMDIISISSFSHRDEGRKAHHAFLNPENGNPILLIEDMNLGNAISFKKVIVAPLMVENADGTPCTIFGYPA
jgi:kynurenine formamidase